jgi:aminoglycoside phosphotransferase family enzyme/predicted kinase
MSNTTHESPGSQLIAGLLRPDAYDHPDDAIRLTETHISWVILAGDFAYKIKKPVDFGFLDFSTLEQRRFFCEEELRLNRRYAPELYLAVLPVTGSPEHPRMGGSGPPLEYAVQLRRFDEALRFDALARNQRLMPEHVDGLAARLAAFHAAIPRAAATDAHGLAERQYEAAALNFTRLRALPGEPGDLAKLDALQAWTNAEYANREPQMRRRKTEGCIRECHGDLHLANIVLLDGRPTLFDGIEFNEGLRWIDVLSELAFVAMDLEVHGEPTLAWRLVNRYLEITGDHAGLPLFDFYRVYRAMVRAKIARLSANPADTPARRSQLRTTYDEYLAYALRVIEPRMPRLIITHGASGSGKSHIAALLAERLPAVRIRSDVERKRLAGIAADDRTGSDESSRIYRAAMTARTYGRLAELAGLLLDAGHSVMVDATFLKLAQRDEQRRVAERRGADFVILDCRAPLEVLRERVKARALAGNDASDADLTVLERQLQSREALMDDELAHTLAVDSGRESAVEDVLAAIAG